MYNLLNKLKGVTDTCIVYFLFTLNLKIHQFCVCTPTVREGCRLNNFLTFIGIATTKQESIVSGSALTHQQQDKQKGSI